MKMIVWAFQSFILTLFNIMSIVGGYCIYKLLNTSNQIISQLIFALVFNIIIFAIWYDFNTRYLRVLKMNLQSIQSFIAASLMGLLWSPFVFAVIHFVIQGYLTSFGNIIGIWLYQITFIIILFIGKYIILLKPKRIKV